MNSYVLAPRPARSNWARVIYNVLHDNGNKALSKEDIWAKVPVSMHVPHALTKFTASLASMVHHKYLDTYGPRSKKGFRIASYETYEARKAELKAYRRKAPAKKKKKATRKYTRRTPVAATAPHIIVNSLQGEIDGRIKGISEQITALINKRHILTGMRKEAGKL